MEALSRRRRHNHHLVLLPYPGRGHINPILHLSSRLASRGDLLVTVVLTEEWLSLVSSPTPPPLPPAVRLRAIPGGAEVVPSERDRGADFASFIRAVLTRMGAPVATLLQELDPSPDAVVADALLPWAPAIARQMGIPVVAYFPQAATVFVALQEAKNLAGLRNPSSEIERIGNEDDFLSYIPRPASEHLADFITHSNGEGMLRAFIEGTSWISTAHCLLFNSFSKLESRAFDKLRSELSVPFYAVGSLVPSTATAVDGAAAERPYYYKWLDAQASGSVLYVSMSSFLPFSRQEIEEFAGGLRASEHPFLWAVRDSERVQELVGERGLVVPWCDQAQVLRHPSVGGFWTHCGWNSTLEGVHAGVPMLTFPLMWDQYPNSKLIVDEWRIGLRLRGEKEGAAIGSEEVSAAVKRLMDSNTAEGEEMRRRVIEMKEKSHAALREKGSSAISFDAFIDAILTTTEENDEE